MTQRNVPRETDDPIAAIATASGKAGIGIIRVSGRLLIPLVESVVGRVPPARVATHARFNDSAGNPIDEGIALYFPAPHSYTGETVLELQGHGGPAVLQALLRRCLELGCRLARPGEFTERAYLNGQLDLAEAEAVADLIEAGSEAAARSAARTLTGAFSLRIQNLVSGLIDLRMHVEACIDFPEEEIDPADRNKQELKLASLVRLLEDLMKDARQGAVLRDGLTVVLIGRPNVGKSSLLNRLAGEDLAIVTPIAGTTRDQVRATVHLNGIPIHLIDTAGLRETDDPVEKIGIERTWQAIANAGAALLIVETGETARRPEAEILSRLSPGLPIAWVANKVDLYQGSQVSRETRREGRNATLSVSALTGEGIDTLRDWLLEVAGWEPGSEGVFMARERHLVALRSASRHLDAAKSVGNQFDIFAEELRLAQQALQAITGEFTADDLLGEIFSRFCIGK